MSNRVIYQTAACGGNCQQKCAQSLWYGALAVQCACALKVPFASCWDAATTVKTASRIWLRVGKRGRKVA